MSSALLDHRTDHHPWFTGSTPPDRSLVQRMEALRLANDIRTRRAQLKRDLKGGRAQVVNILLAPPAHVETMKVFDLLLAAPKCGRVKTNKVLAMAKVSPSKTVGGLTDRQRREIVAWLRRRP